VHAQSLTVIESFWREGQNDWLAGKFINGFFNFYFVLEGLYGDRNTQNRLVQKAFKTSSELISNIGAFLAEDHPDEPLTQLIKMFKVGNRLPTPDEVIEMLVGTRGKLHHFQNNPNRPQGSPMTHDAYHGICYLALCLAHKALLSRAVSMPAMVFGERKP
jgi:hypothetical protein